MIILNKSESKIKGCLIGGAIGDALGYPIRTLSAERIIQKYGPNGLTEYVLKKGVAQISANTQMLLFTTVGLLNRITRGSLRGIAAQPHHYIALCYYDWYKTQTETFPLLSYKNNCWLTNIAGRFSRRSPNPIYLRALKKQRDPDDMIAHPIMKHKDCSAMALVSPIGLAPYTDYTSAYNVAALTHRRELDRLAAAAFTRIIESLSVQDPVLSLEEVLSGLSAALEPDFPHNDYLFSLIQAISYARYFALADVPDGYFISQVCNNWGDGKQQGISAKWPFSAPTENQPWGGEKALAVALYCALKYKDNFEKAVLTAVNHSGNSAVIGSLTGQLMGAALGIEGIEKKWIEPLELQDLIFEIAEDLYFSGSEGISEYRPIPQAWEEKYIYRTYPL